MLDKKIPGHQLIVTQDGSFTLFSEVFDEACHSTHGAHSETLLHYVEGCQILEKALSNSQVNILEVGFGTGLGYMTTHEALQKNNQCFYFLSLEIDENLVIYAKESHHIFKNLIKINRPGYLFYEMPNLRILVGDARVVLPLYLKDFPLEVDAIYQDAFSPKKNPSLWTKEWFLLLKTISKPDVIMSTYSASSSIRKAMIAAGFFVQKGEKFGPKRSSTRARLQGPSDPDILEQLEKSHAIVLEDKNIDTYKMEK